jgi:hypothetical protein
VLVNVGLCSRHLVFRQRSICFETYRCVVDMFHVAIVNEFNLICGVVRRSRYPRGLRRRSAVARLVRLWVRNPPGAWIFFCYECCVLSGRGLCDEQITGPVESYRLWCVVGCNLETSQNRPRPTRGKKSVTCLEVQFWYSLVGTKMSLICQPR